MIVGIELRYVVLGASGGVAQLLKGVLEHAMEGSPTDRFVVFSTVFNRHLLELPDTPRIQVYSLPLHGYYDEVDRLCENAGIDVLFRGYPSEDTLKFPLDRQVFQIPDLQHEACPEFFSVEVLRARRAAFVKAQSGAGAIGTISEYSRRTIRESPHTRCEDIFLMPPALQAAHRLPRVRRFGPDELAMVPTQPYFLFPSNLWPHKNHRGLIDGFRSFLGTRQQPYELVLTGHPDGWEQLRKMCAGLPVRHLGFVRSHLMRLLFERSTALTYFSLYEGFGMPLLEAFDSGTPVLCSDTTSLPEVGGDAVLTCNPADAEAIAALMTRVVDEPGLRGRLIERGRGRLAAYDWSSSAANLLAACRRVHARTGGPALTVELWEERETGHRVASSDAAPAGRTQADGPLVSIVTPSFNQGIYLRRTVESVLAQSYPHIELIVMDGGSTDESVSILKEYGDRIVWASEKDNGQTHAINKGMRRARGQILAYLNSDDVLLPGAVERVVQYFAEHPRAMLVYGKASYIDEHDRVTGDYRTEPYSRQRLAEECIICQPATFWRRSLVDLVGEFDERLHYVMDYDYWLRAAKAGAHIDFLDEPLANSRRYPETKTLSARGPIYREIFATCWRHNRLIGQDYCIGYWHHVLHERSPRLGQMAGWLGYDYVKLGMLHSRYFRWKRVAVERTRALRAVASGGWRRRHAPMASSSKADRTHVSGFCTDNWVEAHLRIISPRRELGGGAYLEGVSPATQTVDILVDGRPAGTRQLTAGARERLEFVFPAGKASSLELVFSAGAAPGATRGHAFFVEATNLFSEQDMHY